MDNNELYQQLLAAMQEQTATFTALIQEAETRMDQRLQASEARMMEAMRESEERVSMLLHNEAAARANQCPSVAVEPAVYRSTEPSSWGATVQRTMQRTTNTAKGMWQRLRTKRAHTNEVSQMNHQELLQKISDLLQAQTNHIDEKIETEVTKRLDTLLTRKPAVAEKQFELDCKVEPVSHLEDLAG